MAEPSTLRPAITVVNFRVDCSVSSNQLRASPPRGRLRLPTGVFAMLWLATASGPPFQVSPAPPKADSLTGEVAALDPKGGRLTVKTDAGSSVEVRTDDKTSFLRARPGSTTLADAAPTTLEEVAVGDRVLARGRWTEEKTSLAARQVVVMTRGDIARKNENEREEWRRRGILGVVSAVDVAKGEITLQLRGLGDAQTVVIATEGRTVVFRRYPPDSVKFGDARPSSLVEVRMGDQLRALGDRGASGSRFLPEQVVFGTFRTVSGAVAAVDAAKGELTVRDEKSRQTLRISVGPDARLRRIPPELGAKLARRREGPGGAGAGGPGGGPLRGTRKAGGGPEDLLDDLPPLTLADVKPADMVLVSSTKGSDPLHLNAIALVVGLEALARPWLRGARAARGLEVDVPPELMDLGMSIP